MMTYKKALTPYPVLLVLRLHQSKSAAAKRMQSNDYGLTTLNDDGTIAIDICLQTVPKESLLNVAIHESVHVCQFLQDHIQTKLDDETQAYLTAYIATWTFAKIAASLSAGHVKHV